jgi:hypothetical protein
LVEAKGSLPETLAEQLSDMDEIPVDIEFIYNQ